MLCFQRFDIVFINWLSDDKRNDSGPVGLPIPYGVPMFNHQGVEAQGGTPDFQVNLSGYSCMIEVECLFLSFGIVCIQF